MSSEVRLFHAPYLTGTYHTEPCTCYCTPGYGRGAQAVRAAGPAGHLPVCWGVLMTGALGVTVGEYPGL
jgi:hypothetical protein